MNGALPERTRTYLQTGAQNGSRNDELLHAACQFRDAGYSEICASEQLVPRASADGLSKHEIASTIRSAFSRSSRGSIRPVAKSNRGRSDGGHDLRIQV